MKLILITITLFSFSSFTFANEKKSSDRTLTLKSRIVKAQLIEGGKYKLELTDHAAAYRIDKKHSACVMKAIKEKKEVTLTVKSHSLDVVDCK